eukprot:CAMPEP_0115154492 /NCGR_PEP_ID=MMETSP0227-20121206/67325_1 /TAXON_ID=89957 /ORGANISM="Polarella glacialis, Strain CCMP 1383" /LENGTH=43 /DNA_ID= /DNA_START= /DNA_END= /DNA_ORIENTATION=
MSAAGAAAAAERGLARVIERLEAQDPAALEKRGRAQLVVELEE